MPIKIGSTAINKIYLGSSEVKKVYFGSTKVFDTSSPASLGTVLASTVFDLDATIAASYTSGQTWSNIETTPADSAGQTDYDMYLGADVNASTDDPTFTGSAGDPGAYFAFDGGDFCNLKSGTNTTFLDALHKTTGGSDWWACMTLKTVDFAGASTMFSTHGATNTAGLRVQFSSAELIQAPQRGDAAGVAGNSSIAVTAASDVIVIISHSHSGNQTRFWCSRSGATGTAEEISQTYSASTSNATNELCIGSLGSGVGNFLESGVRVYSFAMGNEYLDDTKAGLLIAALETRHARDYSP